jgi:hypothetical protein
MARIVHRDTRQLKQLTDVFREAFLAEHNYLCSRHTMAGGPDGWPTTSPTRGYKS